MRGMVLCFGEAKVELMGVEPTTSSLRTTRSGQLSYSPEGTTKMCAKNYSARSAAMDGAGVDAGAASTRISACLFQLKTDVRR